MGNGCSFRGGERGEVWGGVGSRTGAGGVAGGGSGGEGWPNETDEGGGEGEELLS